MASIWTHCFFYPKPSSFVNISLFPRELSKQKSCIQLIIHSWRWWLVCTMGPLRVVIVKKALTFLAKWHQSKWLTCCHLCPGGATMWKVKLVMDKSVFIWIAGMTLWKGVKVNMLIWPWIFFLCMSTFHIVYWSLFATKNEKVPGHKSATIDVFHDVNHSPDSTCQLKLDLTTMKLMWLHHG